MNKCFCGNNEYLIGFCKEHYTEFNSWKNNLDNRMRDANSWSLATTFVLMKVKEIRNKKK